MKYFTKSILILFFLNFYILTVFSNEGYQISRKKYTGDVGIGIGIDYGGIGIQVNQLLKSIYLIGGFGYNSVYFLPFAGIKYYILEKNSENFFIPYVKVVYGYNAVINIQYGPKDFFCGFTPGIGTDIRFGKQKTFGINVDLNYPLRTKKFKDSYDNYKRLYSNFKQEFLPISLSIGLQINMD